MKKYITNCIIIDATVQLQVRPWVPAHDAAHHQRDRNRRPALRRRHAHRDQPRRVRIQVNR